MANANPSSPVSGTASGAPVSSALPAGSESQGGINESTPIPQRAVKGAVVGAGPKVLDNGSYGPASYPLAGGIIRTDR